jgi:hypothetical protein
MIDFNCKIDDFLYDEYIWIQEHIAQLKIDLVQASSDDKIDQLERELTASESDLNEKINQIFSESILKFSIDRGDI